MSSSFCDCVNQWEQMRKLVRITSANRYKIFVTSDKGCSVIVKSWWTFAWSSSNAGLPCYCHKNQTFCSLSTFEVGLWAVWAVGWSCQQPLDNNGLNTFQNIQYKTYSKLSTTTEGKSGLKVQLFNNSTKNIERKGKYGQWTMNVGLCRYWPLAIQNKLKQSGHQWPQF